MATNSIALDSISIPPSLVEVDLFGTVQRTPAKKPAKSEEQTPRIRGSKAVLSFKDFLLPELVERSDEGDPSVKAVSSAEQEQQTLHLLERATEVRIAFEVDRERKRYVAQLRRDPERAAELARFKQAEIQAEENFQLWLAQKANRRARALDRKANRLLNCSITARPMDCCSCGRRGYKRFYCGNRYCRYCGNQVFRRLFAKYAGLAHIVERFMCRDGFRRKAVLATLTFTSANLHRMPTAGEIRKFNEDIRTTLQLVAHELGIKNSQFGVLWCDEFGGWNPKTQQYNTNLHCHGLWLGPFLPIKLLSAVWQQVRGNGDYRVLVEAVPFVDGKPDFARALGHALKYTSKHVSKYSPERLAELDIAFDGVRRVHTIWKRTGEWIGTLFARALQFQKRSHREESIQFVVTGSQAFVCSRGAFTPP